MLFTVNRLFAASNTSWNFSVGSDYTVSDANKIGVNNGDVHLKLVTTPVVDDTADEFNAGTYANTSYTSSKLTTGSGAVAVPTSTSGLVAQYEFENSLVDSVTGATASIHGNSTYTSSSQVGSAALRLDGNGDDVRTPAINLGSTFSISAWIKLNVVYDYGEVVSSGTTDCNISLVTYGNGSIQYKLGNGSTWGNNIASSAGVIQAGVWNYVTALYDGTTASLYLNGTLVGTTTNSGKSYNQVMNIGSRASVGNWLNGDVDEVGFYNVKLTTQQITDIYQRGKGYYGQYTSRVLDSGAPTGASWNTLAWNSAAPFGSQLPDNSQTETTYTSGNVSMTNNSALWHFNNNANDSSGNNRNGTLGGNAQYTLDSKFGSHAASFDGSGDYVSLGNNVFGALGSFTLSAWVKVSDTNTSRAIISEFKAACGDAIWYVADTGKVSFIDGASTANTSDTSIEDNKWHFVVYTYNGSTGRHYIDGVEQSSTTGAPWRNTCSAGDVRIGLDAQGGYSMQGSIDELAVFTRAVTQQEVAAMYNRGVQLVTYQVRSCDDNQCAGESFVGPDGLTTSYYQTETNTNVYSPQVTLTNLGTNRYFQYKLYTRALALNAKPEIPSITVTYSAYPTDKPSISLNSSVVLASIPKSIDVFCEGTLDGSNNCTQTSTKPSGTEIYYQVCNDISANCSANNTWKYWDGDSWENASASQYNTASVVNSNIASFNFTTKYFAFKAFLGSGGQGTPVLTDLTISATLDGIAPSTNASSVNISGHNSGDWLNMEPTIRWTAGQDNVGGIGLLGYCVSLDEATINSTHSTNPASSAGVLQGLNDGVDQDYCPYIVSGVSLDLSNISGLSLSTNKQYNFSIKAVDMAGNIWNGSSIDYQDLFSFKYDGTPPTNPAFISMPSNFIQTREATITWPVGGDNGAADVGEGLAGLQYKIGNNGTWYGDLHNGHQDLTDLLVNDGAYTTTAEFDYDKLLDGSNVVYFRAVDFAGNYSSSSVTGVLKINTTAPGQVQNLQVDPEDNTTNSYSFSWDVPSSFMGEASGIRYCYTINTLPNSSNCTYTSAGVTSIPADAYATQPENNTFNIVAKDEAGNINYDTYTSITFRYSGEAPGLPLNVGVSDISTKETQDWKLAITWAEPTNTGAGVANYKVYRSIVENASCNADPNDFDQISSVLGTSYIDTGLEQKEYYYCVKACDSANNCSAVSSTAMEYPTGKYTSPADLISGPTVNAVTTKKAVISWITDRRSDSRIQYGTASNTYFDEEIGNSVQLTAHTVTLNGLNAGTTYYYRAKWTDEDGNIGVSEEKSFTTDPAPIVTNVKVTSIGISSALLSFTTKSSRSVNLYFGKSTQFGGIQQLETAFVESSYTMVLNNLDDGTKYYFRINPTDIEGVEYAGTVLDFETLPRPTVNGIQIEEVKNVPQPTVKIVWSSNTDISSIVTFYPLGNTAEARDSVLLDLVRDHEITLVGLKAETKYAFVVRGIDKLGNEARSAEQIFTTATDTRPPRISNIKVESINPDSNENTSQIIVSWETDELSTSQVDYGEGTNGGYNQSTQVDRNYGYKHVVIITNLKPSNVYHLRAVSADSSNNVSTTDNIVTITPKQQQGAFDIVIKGLSDIFSFL